MNQRAHCSRMARSMLVARFLTFTVITFSQFSISASASKAEVTLTLVHEVSLGSFGGTDCWGWTSPDSTQYAIMGTSWGLAIVDAVAGTLVDSIPGPTGCSQAYWRDMVTYRHYVYCVSECGGTNAGMMIVDLQYLPDSAHFVGTWYPSTQNTSHNMAIDTALGIGYAVKPFNSGMRGIDLSDPENPLNINLWVGVLAPTSLHDMYARNDTVWAALGNDGAFAVWDMTSKNIPITISTFAPAGAGYAHNIWPTDDGRHVVTTEETANRSVKIWNVEDYENVQLVGQYLAPSRLAHNAQVWGDYIYISHYESGVAIVDMSDPSLPIEAARYDTWPQSDTAEFDGCWGVFEHTSNGMVFGSNMNGKLFILQTNIVHTDFDASPRVVEAGLPVQFSDISPTYSSSWHWDFGDGDTSSAMSPTHVFAPGIYDIDLNAGTPTAGDGYKLKTEFVTSLAETLSSGSFEELRNTSTYWEVSCSNNVPIESIDLPVILSNVPSVVFFDSISTVGTRTEYFEYYDIIFDNRFFGQMAVRLRADNGGGSPPLPPGNGPIARVYIRTHPTAPLGGTSQMTSGPLDIHSLKATTTTTQFVPHFNGGTLTIATPEIGDINHDGDINVLDVIALINYVFRSGPAPDPESLGDTNCDGPINVLDVTALIDFVFRSGPVPCT